MNQRYYCMNRAIYALMVITIEALCIYTFITQWGSGWGNYQVLTAIAAFIIAPLWGGSFILLHFEMDALGVSRKLLGEKRILWADLSSIELAKSDEKGQARTELLIKSKQGESIKLSSDLLSLEAMEEIVNKLREDQRLPQAADTQEEV